MSRLAFNDNYYGDYDFFLQHVQIYISNFHISPKRAQEIVSDFGRCISSENELRFYQTYIHELTHFIDCNCTLWGISFTARMFNYYRNKTKNSLDVFGIDFSEISKHNKLKNANDDTKLRYETIKVSPNYNSEYGTFIAINYIDYDQVVHSTPISTISVLENHAYAQEKLYAINYYQKKCDFLSVIILQNEVQDLLKNSDRTEYTALIALSKRVLPQFDLEHILKLTVLISKAVMNIPFLYSFFTNRAINHIFKSFPDNWTKALRTDFARGANLGSRYYVFLMWIATYNDLKPIPQDDSFNAAIWDLMMNACHEGLDRQKFEEARIIELEQMCKRLSEYDAELSLSAARQDFFKGELMLNPLHFDLPDISLDSGEIIEAGRRLSVNIETHTSGIMNEALDLESKSLVNPRMHLSLKDSQSFYGRAFNWYKSSTQG